VVAFLPEEGDGYWNYPENGETPEDQYRSFARRDLVQLVKYAAAGTRCLSAGWDRGNHAPLGLGDMSEANGGIPGSREGDPDHPGGTHVDGHDMDIAYYQIGPEQNLLRAVCDHASGGEEAYHCTGVPDRLDVWRTALFLGLLHHSPQLRVVGVDGRVGPLVESALRTLCARGFLDGAACEEHALAWEEEDTGRGWFYHHHHHLHVSVLGQGRAVPPGVVGAGACITVDCR